ncbi:MAG: SpvB/TcaC N-terminal domain-containing protein [Candidatus Dormibacteria bacterium]
MAVFLLVFALAPTLHPSPALAAQSTAPAMLTPGKFSVDDHGAFTYTVPIAAPPGTAGMVPALSLDYGSQTGNGLEGLGWSLEGLPAIGRTPARPSSRIKAFPPPSPTTPPARTRRPRR